MRRRLTFAALALAVHFLASPGPAAAQCVMCKAALTDSAEGRAVSEEFNLAILVMLFAPYAVLGSLGAILMRRRLAGALRRSLQRARAARRPPWAERRDRGLRVH